jgi:hypothetical protein
MSLLNSASSNLKGKTKTLKNSNGKGSKRVGTSSLTASVPSKKKSASKMLSSFKGLTSDIDKVDNGKIESSASAYELWLLGNGFTHDELSTDNLDSFVSKYNLAFGRRTGDDKLKVLLAALCCDHILAVGKNLADMQWENIVLDAAPGFGVLRSLQHSENAQQIKDRLFEVDDIAWANSRGALSSAKAIPRSPGPEPTSSLEAELKNMTAPTGMLLHAKGRDPIAAATRKNASAAASGPANQLETAQTPKPSQNVLPVAFTIAAATRGAPVQDLSSFTTLASLMTLSTHTLIAAIIAAGRNSNEAAAATRALTTATYYARIESEQGSKARSRLGDHMKAINGENPFAVSPWTFMLSLSRDLNWLETEAIAGARLGATAQFFTGDNAGETPQLALDVVRSVAQALHCDYLDPFREIPRPIVHECWKTLDNLFQKRQDYIAALARDAAPDARKLFQLIGQACLMQREEARFFYHDRVNAEYISSYDAFPVPTTAAALAGRIPNVNEKFCTFLKGVCSVLAPNSRHILDNVKAGPKTLNTPLAAFPAPIAMAPTTAAWTGPGGPQHTYEGVTHLPQGESPGPGRSTGARGPPRGTS